MKIFCKIVVVPCVLILALSSCNQKSKDVSMKANATTRAFVEKMVKGETTREQEQAFIRVVADITFEIDRNLRGTEKAERTKATATAVMSGIDINAPIRFEETNSTK